MNVSKNFPKLVKSVQEENAKRLPDVFVTEGSPAATDIAGSELGEKDALGRYTLTHKDTAIKAKLDRGVAEGLDSYNLIVKKSIRPITITGQEPIAPGYMVFRLVAA